MERRKAIAVAAAITMSLTSGVVALGTNFGALGFGGASNAAAASQNAVVATAPAAQPAAVNTTFREREHDDRARAAQAGANSAASTRGELNG
jgi:hypothetical protein